ncbi:hypothetical protein E1956_09080 [Paraburkholderia pallida]|uniref:Lipoprotein n=1 Tax=Paraburkholderia pallida TaxID=2547399 RepID=A0A4P7CSP0_9BURK|nr:hypothetical protein E1956_09080 [Paraburkholderia pallida]
MKVSKRLGIVPVLLCVALVAGCDKQNATVSDLSKKSADAAQQAAQLAASQAAAQAAQTLDKAASYVNQQLDTAQRKLDQAASQTQAQVQPQPQGEGASASIAEGASASADALASQARGQWQAAASAAHAMLGNAAAATGTGLSMAGSSLQRWASSGAAAAGPASGGSQ